MTAFQPDDDRLYQDPALARFYDLENGWAADFDTCLGLAEEAASVLDLGCGTGELAARLADGRAVVGIDPAAPMLAVARQRPGGDRVEWLEADARGLDLGRRFDLIVLTGHAFQVFLTADDQRAVLATIARHLAPEGRFIFDSRNPAAGAWRGWTPERSRRSLAHPQLGAVEAWNDVAQDAATGIVTYRTHYRVAASGQTFSAASKLRFTDKVTLTALLTEAGLHVERWLGDWQGGPSTDDSPELIPIGRRL
ncbi:class I SAM-dependent methyltransferase [Pelagibius sp.]|uniref:class I SAM-dependent methyltransferase n=1 Tax=Pelagibius sp. TaxID=1931238 RepID=UPI003B510CA0